MNILGFLFGWPEDLISKTITLHPSRDKKEIRMSKVTYEVVKFMIFDLLKKEKDVTNVRLQQFVEGRLRSKFGNAVSWYYMNVRYDLEARRIIEYVSTMSPHRVRLR